MLYCTYPNLYTAKNKITPFNYDVIVLITIISYPKGVIFIF